PTVELPSDSISNPVFTLVDALFSINIFGVVINVVGPVAIDLGSLPTAIAGESYSASLTSASGGVKPYQWSAIGLPAWLTVFKPANPANDWLLKGTVPPDEANGQTYEITLTATDSWTPAQTASVTLELVVIRPPSLSDIVHLPTAVLGKDYGAALEIVHGTAPYLWSISGLPDGLTLESDGSTTATISGKVAKTATTGATTLHLTVKDASQPQTTLDIDVPLIVARPVTLATALLPTAISGETYDLTLSAFGGVAPYTWSATGLPPGLSMSASGAIAGETALGDEGSYVVNVTITDSSTPPLVGLDKRLLIVDEEYVQLAITTTSLPVAAVGDVYGSGILVATGAESLKNLVWTAFGLPDGLELIQGNDGQWSIEGTPAPATSGVYSVQVTVTDSVLKQSASAIYPLFVEDDGDDEIVPPDPSAVVAQPSLVGVAAGACALGVSEDSTTQRIAIIAAIVAALVGSHLSRSSRRDE
ncbi:MAG: putative Ig domain-containing protein, partial [Planctomycetaceae bacterium]|nr:putative Ig domain-containing protein [Planctomycetaceae bacterium]